MDGYMNGLINLFSGRPIKVAVAQTCIWHNRTEKNIELALQMMREVSHESTDLICLPAAFATGLNFPSLKRDAQTIDGPIMQTLQREAAALSVTVVAGILERDGDDIFDTAVYIDEQGKLLGKYRRNSIWEGESEYISRGNPAEVIETPHGRIGLLVGYDIRFPEACRGYFAQDVDMIVCVANLFSKFGFSVETLCRARAAENSCYFVLANCLGENGFAMLEYMGRSLVVDGNLMEVEQDRERDVLARGNLRESVIRADIFVRRKKKVAGELPYKADFLRIWNSSISCGRE